MWIFAQKGFVSIVEDGLVPGNFQVRGRVRDDIEALFPKARVSVTTQADYRFRASIPRDAVAAAVVAAIADIRYDNFKNSTPDDRHAPYAEVWRTMYNLQIDRAVPRRQHQRRNNKKKSMGKKNNSLRALWLEPHGFDCDWHAGRPCSCGQPRATGGIDDLLPLERYP